MFYKISSISSDLSALLHTNQIKNGTTYYK